MIALLVLAVLVTVAVVLWLSAIATLLLGRIEFAGSLFVLGMLALLAALIAWAVLLWSSLAVLL